MAVLEPDSKEWTDAFNIENIPRTLLDNTYHILLGDTTSSSQNDLHIEDSMEVNITIFQRAYNSPVESRDTVLDRAQCIKMDLLNPRNVEAFNMDIDAIEAVSVITEEIDLTNDNIVKATITITARLFYGTIS